MSDVERRFYSITEAVIILGFSRDTLYRAIREKELPAVTLRGKLLIPKEAIDNLGKKEVEVPK